MNLTSIEWTHRPGTTGMTWNPIRSRRKSTGKTGTFCTRISPGCKHCYASTINKRFGTGAEYEIPNLADHEFFIDERILNEPLKRNKPATIFVGDMFDLFHEAIPADLIVSVFEVMSAAEQHVFQVLTKRIERADEVLFGEAGHWYLGGGDYIQNIWFGTSIESPDYVHRARVLVSMWEGLRFLSVEPLLADLGAINLDGINWLICGGESGPGARAFNLSWAESLLKQCKAAEVPFFFKQTGSNPYWSKPFNQPDWPILVSAKGGDMSEWPEHLRVREFPV